MRVSKGLIPRLTIVACSSFIIGKKFSLALVYRVITTSEPTPRAKDDEREARDSPSNDDPRMKCCMRPIEIAIWISSCKSLTKRRQSIEHE